MPRPQPIRIGDKFRMESGAVVEVIETRPGGHVELIDRDKSRFHHRYTREVREWPRVTT